MSVFSHIVSAADTASVTECCCASSHTHTGLDKMNGRTGSEGNAVLNGHTVSNVLFQACAADKYDRATIEGKS